MPTSRGLGVWKRIGAKLPQAGIVLVVFLIGLFYGRYALSTTYWSYDDEGYMLLSLDHYLGGEHLYSEVYSQYGPFYFFTQKAFFRSLMLPVDHDAGRLVTLVCWMLSALLAGYFIYKVAFKSKTKNTTRNVAFAAAAGWASMWQARSLANEPGHPQQVVLVMFMLGCCASVYGGVAGSLLLGACGVALLLTKINVGIFFLAAAALTVVCRFPPGRIRKVGGFCLLAYAVSIPLILMHRDVPGWAGGYCLLAILCGVSTFLAGLLMTPSSPKPMRSALSVLIGALATMALMVIGTMWQGLSLRTLIEGVVWGPLRHPGVFETPLKVWTATVIGGMLVTIWFGWLYYFRDRWPVYSRGLGILRSMTGLYTIWLLTDPFINRPVWTVLPFLTIFLPLGLIPRRDGAWRPSDYFPRLFVSALAATQLLQGYPVSGTQLGIAEAPLLLWAFICVHDGIDELFELIRPAREWLRDTGSREAMVGVVLICLLTGTILRERSWRVHYPFPASSLRCSSSLHLPPQVEGTYEFLAKNIETNCEVLFTMPGMGSLNFWSGVPTPNGLNVTAWMKELNLEQQEQILQILRMNSRACVVYNPHLVASWQTTPEDLDELPLAHYILHDMRRVSQKMGYEILVNPDQNSPWIEAGTLSAP